MKKQILVLGAFLMLTAALTAQSDEDLFGSADDDFFGDDGIVELDETDTTTTAAEETKKGVLFETGSIKVGGNYSTSLSNSTTLYADDEKKFSEHLSESTLTPTASAYLSVDARPSQTLRMYTKFGLAYPFTTDAYSYLTTTDMDLSFLGMPQLAGVSLPYPTGVNTTVADWLQLKELFTDFSIADRAFFRFGLHTVTWGTGYFFSPVSDMINTSSINPEDTSAQVEGSLNLRTQITFKNTQDCLWFYVIPDTNFLSDFSNATYTKYTALAGKADLVFGGWEFGLGGFWKYENAPKAMITTSGSLGKLSIFGEGVYSYGSATEWSNNKEWNDKTNIFQATIGCSYMWKTPSIMVATQYYYDGNKSDMTHQYFTYGHNIAALATFGRIFGTKDVTATVFGMVNIGKEELPDAYKTYLEAYGISSYLSAATFSALMSYSPISEFTISAGPYLTWQKLDKAPNVALKLTCKLGGGKF